jgi:hypothetical protein
LFDLDRGILHGSVQNFSKNSAAFDVVFSSMKQGPGRHCTDAVCDCRAMEEPPCEPQGLGLAGVFLLDHYSLTKNEVGLGNFFESDRKM